MNINTETSEKEVIEIEKYDRFLAVAMNDHDEDMVIYMRGGEKGAEGVVELADLISEGIVKPMRKYLDKEDQA